MKFLDCVIVNPKISLKKGKVYPFIEMANVSTSYREPLLIEYKSFDSGAKFQDGDTVIARITPCLQNGKRFYCKNIGTGFGSTEYLVFRPKNKLVNNLFLYYFMQTEFIKLQMINSMVGATGRQRVNNNVFNDIELNLPDIKIQKNIGKTLSAYDDLIENNQKQIKLLEEAAQRLYKEWFVDLRFPDYEKTPIIDGVPKGWKKELVNNLLENVKRTKEIKSSDYKNVGLIPIIDQSRNFLAGYTNDKEALINKNLPVIIFGDHTRILKFILFPFAKGADGTQLIISNNNRMPQSLLYFSLIAVDLSNYHYARHYKYLKAKSILVPTKKIGDEFDKYIFVILLQIQKLRDISTKCVEARNRLLSKLMSGEMDV